MPIPFKSAVIVKVQSQRSQEYEGYVWLMLGFGLLWLLLKVLVGWRYGSEFDRAFFEQFGYVGYVYRSDSVRDHELEYRASKSLFNGTVWGLSLVYGLIGGAVYAAYRLYGIYYVYRNPAEAGVGEGGVALQVSVETALIFSLCFILPFAVLLWWSIRQDFINQVLEQRGPAQPGTFYKVVPFVEWDEFRSKNTAAEDPSP